MRLRKIAAISFGIRAKNSLLPIRNGADIDAKGEHNYTPLMETVSYNHLPLIRSLLEHGVDMTPRNDLGFTALDLAESDGYEEAAALLRARLW